MVKLRIKNFGPIRYGCESSDGWIEFKKITVFIGDQGTGKSTIAKIFSTFSWLEKAVVKKELDEKIFATKSFFRSKILSYHRIEDYLNDGTVIEYDGEGVYFKYENGELSFSEKRKRYQIPQIMYIPSERNILTFLKNPQDFKMLSGSLLDFLSEIDLAKKNIKWPMQLPISDVNLDYDKLNDIINLKGEDFKVRLTDASSGFQSIVPVVLVTKNLIDNVISGRKINDKFYSKKEIDIIKREIELLDSMLKEGNISFPQRRQVLSVLLSRFNESYLVNIVEEPEQNLFPLSQRKLVEDLLVSNNRVEKNKLVLTTHSPYVVNAISIATQAKYLLDKINLLNDEDKKNHALDQVANILNINSAISADDVVVYELCGKGRVHVLPMKYGVPSDQNYLNQQLKEGNSIFGKLIDIEELL